MPDSGFFNRSLSITPSDTVNYDGTTFNAASLQKALPADAIYVGGAGTVTVVYENGQTNQFTAVAGEILPLRTIRVNSTGTAATLMNALYTV